MRLKVFAIILAVGALVVGCSPASRAVNWAEETAAKAWTAQYRICFHQKDGDIKMDIQETQAETLVLDITMPNGTLRLEYGPDNILIDLDQGGLEWTDFSRQPPYYSLSELSKRILIAGELGSEGDWASLDGYLIKVKDGIPTEVKYGSEWTIYLDSFIWN